MQVATDLHFATDRFAVDLSQVDALSYLALQVLVAEKNNFEAEQAKQAQEEQQQASKNWQTPL